MRFHNDGLTGNILIFTNEFGKGIWQRKFKSCTVNYDIIIIINIDIIKMSLSSSRGKKIATPEALSLQKIERKQ